MLIDSLVSGSASDILHRLSVDNDPLSYPFHVEPKRSFFNEINATSIKGDVKLFIYSTEYICPEKRDIGINMVLLDTTKLLHK